MKKLLFLILSVVLVCGFTSCSKAGKVVEKASKFIDDGAENAAKYGDDAIRIYNKYNEPNYKEQRCNHCNGSGRAYSSYYGEYRSCFLCGGDGVMTVRED